MKLPVPYQKGSNSDYRYYCRDAEDFLKNMNYYKEIEYLGKECKDGIIIGIENSTFYSDFYFIVYDPRTNNIKYQLPSNKEFIDSIICG